MAKSRTKKRTYRMINFKVYYDTDQDLLDWWEGIEAGERSDTVRDMIREQLGITRQKPKASMIDLPELREVRRDTSWIRDALNDMPAYLERIIQHIAANSIYQPVSVIHDSPASVQKEPALTDVDTERRIKRMKKARW